MLYLIDIIHLTQVVVLLPLVEKFCIAIILAPFVAMLFKKMPRKANMLPLFAIFLLCLIQIGRISHDHIETYAHQNPFFKGLGFSEVYATEVSIIDATTNRELLNCLGLKTNQEYILTLPKERALEEHNLNWIMCGKNIRKKPSYVDNIKSFLSSNPNSILLADLLLLISIEGAKVTNTNPTIHYYDYSELNSLETQRKTYLEKSVFRNAHTLKGLFDLWVGYTDPETCEKLNLGKYKGVIFNGINDGIIVKPAQDSSKEEWAIYLALMFAKVDFDIQSDWGGGIDRTYSDKKLLQIFDELLVLAEQNNFIAPIQAFTILMIDNYNASSRDVVIDIFDKLSSFFRGKNVRFSIQNQLYYQMLVNENARRIPKIFEIYPIDDLRSVLLLEKTENPNVLNNKLFKRLLDKYGLPELKKINT